MGKFRKKIVVPVTLIIVGCIVLATVVFNDSLTQAKANVSFNGIASKVNLHDSKSPFNVVELVPDAGYASIGYLMAGEEPDAWLNKLSATFDNQSGASAARTTYINTTLKNKLIDITETDGSNSKQLHYETYQESYAREGDDWLELDLADYDKIPSGTQGYVMEDLGQGNGDYTFQKEYEPVQNSGTGTHNQNVDYYKYVENPGVGNERGFYSVAFSPVINDDSATNAERFTDRKAYEPQIVDVIVSSVAMQNVITSNPNAQIYMVNNSDTTGPYEYLGIASTYDGIMSVLDFDSYTYFTLEFEYVQTKDITEDKTYYVVKEDSVMFKPDKSGEYGAILDQSNPYIEAPNGGNFVLKQSSNSYFYVGPGNGNYIIKKSDGDSLDYDVMTTRGYYKGGFTNNEWFKYGVFDQEGSKSSKDMCFDVCTTIPASLDHFEPSRINLLYLSSSKSKLTTVNSGYSADNDISWDTALAIAQRAHLGGIMMPVIVDYSIFNGSVSSNSLNVQKLAALLCCTNYDELNIKSDTTSDTIDWTKLKFKSDSDNHYVNANVYVIPANSDTDIPFLFKDFSMALTASTSDENAFKSDAENIGFGEIAEYINDENTIRKKENEAGTGVNYDYFDLVISKSIVIEYIVSYADRRATSSDDLVNILDIEPFKADKNTEGVLTYNKLKEWLGTSCPEEEKVKISYITSSEFVGRIEDLNKYDMIYFGLSTSNKHKENGKTVYNDSNMDGLIYSNVGDIVVAKVPSTDNGHYGLLYNDYTYDGTGKMVGANTTLTPRSSSDYANAINTYRYSGNDITRENISKLENYLKAGFPIVMADGFLSYGYSSGVNEEYIDNCSNIYTFIVESKDKDNFLSASPYAPYNKNVKNGKLHEYLNTEKPEIILGYQDTVENQNYVKLDSSEMSLEFNINNKGGVDPNAKFNVRLMLDSNSDGKFSDKQEVIDANDIRLLNNGKLVSPQISSDGKYYYELSAGMSNNYKLSYELPAGYVGIIPWKLKVSQASNEYRYDSQSGYFYREKDSSQKEKLNILQINSCNRIFGQSLNLQNEYNNTNSIFRRLCNQVDDFELVITTKDAEAYGNEYFDGYLNAYDMIILGFGDCYEIKDTNGCVQGIRDYIAEGKPVLFTHDTTSFSNDARETQDNYSGYNHWGYDFNTTIRDVVGMDRYAVMNNEALKKGITLDKNNWQTAGYYYQALAYAQANNTDLAYVPKSNKTKISRQNQGFTYNDMTTYGIKNTDYNKYTYLYGLNYQSRYQSEMNVTQVNSGQITTYPFLIPETFQVSKTHTQYYQLDLNQDSDDDGESDIVVWYALGGTGYDISPNDVRNNYYIYTMGNVTYSGVGHSSIAGNETELKLYINTMIAAYGASPRAPKITLKETPEEDAEKLGTLYVSIDDAINESVDGNNAVEEVYFKLKDTNLIRNRKTTVCYADFYIPVSKAEYDSNSGNPDYITLSDNGSMVYLKRQDWSISAPDENSSYNLVKTKALQSNVTYKVDVPLSTLPSGSSSITVYCVAYSDTVQYASDGVSDGKVIRSPSSYETFQIQRIGLSDLD